MSKRQIQVATDLLLIWPLESNALQMTKLKETCIDPYLSTRHSNLKWELVHCVGYFQLMLSEILKLVSIVTYALCLYSLQIVLIFVTIFVKDIVKQ